MCMYTLKVLRVSVGFLIHQIMVSFLLLSCKKIHVGIVYLNRSHLASKTVLFTTFVYVLGV